VPSIRNDEQCLHSSRGRFRDVGPIVFFFVFARVPVRKVHTDDQAGVLSKGSQPSPVAFCMRSAGSDEKALAHHPGPVCHLRFLIRQHGQSEGSVVESCCTNLLFAVLAGWFAQIIANSFVRLQHQCS